MELSLNLITQLTPKTTSQELFDYVASFLLKQGKQSRTPGGGGSCVYRGPNGLMCAAGCVIPDEFYDPQMEGVDISTVLEGKLKTKGPQRRFWKALGKHEGLLAELQAIHDGAYVRYKPKETRQSWLNELRRLARNHRLVFDESLAEPAEDSTRAMIDWQSGANKITEGLTSSVVGLIGQCSLAVGVDRIADCRSPALPAQCMRFHCDFYRGIEPKIPSEWNT